MHESTTRWQDRFSRKPGWFINPFGGNRDIDYYPEGNARGYRREFRGPNALAWLMEQIHVGIRHGARRFFINRPMGTDGSSWVTSAAWLSLESDLRQGLQECIPALIDALPDIEIYPFIGSRMSHPQSIRGQQRRLTDEFFHLNGPRNDFELKANRMTLGGLIGAGFSGIVMDSGTIEDNFDMTLDLAQSLRRYGLHVISEAYPVERDQQGKPSLLENQLSLMPYYATADLVDRLVGFNGSMKFDESETRMFVVYPKSTENHGGHATLRDQVTQSMRCGMIPVTQDPEIFKLANDYYIERLTKEQIR